MSEIKSKKISVGSEVMIRYGATNYEGKQLQAYVYPGTYKVSSVEGDKVCIDAETLNIFINAKDLILQ